MSILTAVRAPRPGAATTKSIFDKTGLAALSDLESAEWKRLFSLLEQQQSQFLAKQHLFRSPEYKWPKDALHNWSRIWEYPYAYYHLSRWSTELAPGTAPVIADVGSGVTFFPFSIAELGFKVICTDIDPICGVDFARAREHVPTKAGAVEFRLCKDRCLPFRDAECDAVYCISVLEHIPDFLHTIAEIHRSLKPGGLFVLTIDLDLQGTSEIGIGPFGELVGALRDRFELVCPETIVHPADALLNTTGPWAMYRPNDRSMLKHLVKQEIKRVLGRPNSPYFSLLLAVQGFVLRK